MEEFEKQVYENQEATIKILNRSIEFYKKAEELQDRLNKASQLVRKYTYSIHDKKNKIQETKVELCNEKLEELMKLLEG